MNIKTLQELASVAASNTNAPVAYSYEGENYSLAEVNDTLRNELNALTSTPSLWRENKNIAFQIMEQTIDEVLPVRVIEQYGQFADIQHFPQNAKIVFRQRVTEASRRRAKQFVTRVALAGRYEVFKLDGAEFELKTSAYGGACQIAIEEFLDGRITMADVMDIVLEGLDDIIYREIANALIGSVAGIQAANKHVSNAFNESAFDELIAIADTYGQSTIYCTLDFASTIAPSNTSMWSEKMKDAKWENGYLGAYKRHNVIVLKQSYTDETNATKVIDPGFAWIIPTGAEKPIKIAFEGNTQVRELDREDWSKEVQVYKKVGIGAVVRNNICVYVNTALTFNTSDNKNASIYGVTDANSDGAQD